MSQARNSGTQTIAFMRRDITFNDTGNVLTVGVLPAGAVVLKPISGVNVTTVFNAGTNNFMDIGTSGTGDLYGTDLSLLALGFIPVDEAVAFYVSSDTTVTCTVQLSGTPATTGVGQVVIAFIPPN